MLGLFLSAFTFLYNSSEYSTSSKINHKINERYKKVTEIQTIVGRRRGGGASHERPRASSFFQIVYNQLTVVER